MSYTLLTSRISRGLKCVPTSNLHADNKGFQEWCQHPDHAELINETMYALYERETSFEEAKDEKDQMTEKDAEITEGG